MSWYLVKTKEFTNVNGDFKFLNGNYLVNAQHIVEATAIVDKELGELDKEVLSVAKQNIDHVATVSLSEEACWWKCVIGFSQTDDSGNLKIVKKTSYLYCTDSEQVQSAIKEDWANTTLDWYVDAISKTKITSVFNSYNLEAAKED
jgi:hypothetical protein